jgi:flagellar biosynthetic protein FliP
MERAATLIAFLLAVTGPVNAQAPSPASAPTVPAASGAAPSVNPAAPGNAASQPATPGNAASQPATPGNAASATNPANSAPAPAPYIYVPQIPLDGPSGPVSIATAKGLPANNGGLLQIQGLQGQSVPWSIVVLLGLLTLIPSILVCVTPFARLLIVFHFLRQALGLQTTPSNQTLIGLSLILTFFLMQPVGTEIYETAVVPMQSGQITAMDALGRAEVPMRKFMSHYVREKDVALFVDLAKEPRPATVDDISMRVMLPAYILSELKAGFQIGTVLFLPFLIIDMVVASITTSVGMLQLPPVVISTPLKLLLFLMVDGWHLLVGSLMRSFS